MRETRMKAGEMDFNRPKTLVSVVTEKGSGSKAHTSYDSLRRVRGQLKRAWLIADCELYLGRVLCVSVLSGRTRREAVGYASRDAHIVLHG